MSGRSRARPWFRDPRWIWVDHAATEAWLQARWQFGWRLWHPDLREVINDEARFDLDHVGGRP